MKWQKILYVLLLSFIIALPLSAKQSVLKNILPENMEDQGWQAEDEAFIAIDEDSLSIIINGAAPRYFELGTIKAAFVNYEKKQVYLMLGIYETRSNKNAEELFEEFKSDNSKPLKNLGTESRFTSEMGGSYMVEYFQNKFYVRLSVTKKSEQTKKSILKCAKTISDKISKQAQ
jgi:hypothetical protein